MFTFFAGKLSEQIAAEEVNEKENVEIVKAVTEKEKKSSNNRYYFFENQRNIFLIGCLICILKSYYFSYGKCVYYTFFHHKSLKIVPNQTCTAQPSRMSHFGELPDVVGGYFTKFLRKCQKSPFLGAKCTNLVNLAETRFQCYQMTALLDMNIF